MSTFNKALIAALVVQVGLVVVIRASSDSGETIRNPEPLLADFAKDQVTRVAIFDAPGDTPGDAKAGEEGEDQAGEPVIDLRRESSGSEVSWKLASHYGYPAKTVAVGELLDKLERLQTRGPVVTSTVRHKQLQVADDDYQRKLVIETGTSQITLYVGAPAGSRQVSVRLGGQDDVHQVGELSTAGLSTSPTSWVDTSYLDLPHKRVAYLSVRNQSGTYELQRNQNDIWTLVQDGQPYPVPPGKKFNAVAADNWLKDAVRIDLAEPADPERSIDTPLATITLRMKSETPEKTPAAGDADAPAAEGQAPGQPGEGQPAGQPAEGQEAEQEGSQGSDAAQGASAPAMSQGVEEYILEVGAEEDDKYYVRLLGSPTAALVRKASLRTLVEMNDDVVLVSAEK